MCILMVITPCSLFRCGLVISVIELKWPHGISQNTLKGKWHSTPRSQVIKRLFSILFDSIPYQVGAHLVFVFGDVGVDLVQSRHAVELAEVQAGLLC